ncbi:MAG: hypothetical protein Kow0029_00710 [Candidatus Rifleibacteriota bacterium]
MKKIAFIFVIAFLPLLVACSVGSSNNDAALNPYGFQISGFDITNAATLGTNDVRAIVRPLTTGSAYVGTAVGIMTFNPGDAIPVFSAVTGSPANINKLVADGTTGNFYACTDTGLYLYDAAAKTFTLDANVGAKKVLTFKRQSPTVFWVGLEDLTAAATVIKVDNGVATSYGAAQGITASAVADIYVDANIVMACGTGDTGKGGLFRYDPSSNQFIKQVVNVGLDKGASLFFTIGTNWYAGGPTTGLIVSSDNGTSWTAIAGLANTSPVDFAVEINPFSAYQRFWIATDKATYLTYDLTNFEPFSSAKGLAGDSAKQVYTGIAGTVWIANDGASGGISRLAFTGN